MKLDSKYFDSIRIAPRKARGQESAAPAGFAELRPCERVGCQRPATHRAPAHPRLEGVHRWFCLEHVREYNQSFNYFEGMSDEEVLAYQTSNLTGHRPTWSMGVNPWSRRHREGTGSGFAGQSVFEDPFGFFGMNAAESAEKRGDMPRRPPHNAERRSLRTLGLDETASLNEIKSRYKELVKKYHPDANGGDRAAEERLRAVIQAHDYLKKSGYCQKS